MREYRVIYRDMEINETVDISVFLCTPFKEVYRLAAHKTAMYRREGCSVAAHIYCRGPEHLDTYVMVPTHGSIVMMRMDDFKFVDIRRCAR